jgi:hypothetical protein
VFLSGLIFLKYFNEIFKCIIPGNRPVEVLFFHVDGQDEANSSFT